MKRLQLDRKICMIILAACAVLVVLYKVLWSDALVANEVLAGWVTDAEFRKAMLDTMVMDTAGFIVFICMTIYMGYRVFNPLTKPIFKSLLFVLPSLAVAINNFPLIGLAHGRGYGGAVLPFYRTFRGICIPRTVLSDGAGRPI